MGVDENGTDGSIVCVINKSSLSTFIDDPYKQFVCVCDDFFHSVANVPINVSVCNIKKRLTNGGGGIVEADNVMRRRRRVNDVESGSDNDGMRGGIIVMMLLMMVQVYWMNRRWKGGHDRRLM